MAIESVFKKKISDSAMASVAIVYNGTMLLTREKRNNVSKLCLPGGKALPGETFAATAAREAWEETRGQLSDATVEAIKAIKTWTEVRAASQHVGVLHLQDNEDSDVHLRFHNVTAANSNPRSKTVQEGLEWHLISNVRIAEWRKENLHFHGDHLARVACASLA